MDGELMVEFNPPLDVGKEVTWADCQHCHDIHVDLPAVTNAEFPDETVSNGDLVRMAMVSTCPKTGEELKLVVGLGVARFDDHGKIDVQEKGMFMANLTTRKPER